MKKNVFDTIFFLISSWQFDEEAFVNVSEEGKDFIRKLLIKTKEKRLNAHECLQHQWLTGDHSHKTLEIARNRFFAIREKIRQKYANWNEFVLPLGRLSEFSSLRKLQTEKYRMQEVLIDRKCAAPRFVIKPQSTFALEGNLYVLMKISCIFFMHLRFHEISKHSLTITTSRLQNRHLVKMQGHTNEFQPRVH